MREVDWLVDLVGESGVNKREMGCYNREDGEFNQRDSIGRIGQKGGHISVCAVRLFDFV